VTAVTRVPVVEPLRKSPGWALLHEPGERLPLLLPPPGIWAKYRNGRRIDGNGP
jgi:hypothetical protein